jgi:hypothetical protein
LQPNAFDNAAWTKEETTIDDNATTEPTGAGTGADSMLETTNSAFHDVLQSVAKAAADITYDVSVYIKGNSRTRASLYIDDGAGNGQFVTFDLAGVQVGDAISAYGSGVTGGTAAIDNTGLNTDWVLCSVNGITFSSARTAVRLVIAVDNLSGVTGTNNTFAGDITKGLYLFGASLVEA